MKLRYRVHSAVMSPFQTKAKLPNGSEVEATVNALIVELVPEGHDGGPITHRLPSPSDEAVKLFQHDVVIEVNFATAGA